MMQNNTTTKFILKVFFILVAIPLMLWLIPVILQAPLQIPRNSTLIVKSKLFHAYNAIKDYSEDYNKYPSTENWCDLILPYIHKNLKNTFTSTAINSSIAFNPNAKPDSPDNVVLLFECTGPSWNASGQSELLVQKTRNGKLGCHVLYNNGDTKFIKPDQVKDLNWGNEP